MSAYPPPQEFNPVFNESEYNTSNDGLTQASGDLRYLKLTGGVLSGLTTFSSGLQTPNIYNAGNTFSVPSSSGQLALVSQIPSSSGFVDTTTNQSINGIKTFSTNPIISAISNSGFDLSIPTITGADTIASLGLTQTFSATKNFTALTGLATAGVYPRTSASTQYSSTFTTPAIQIGGSTNDGIYSSGTDIIDIGVNGTNYISLQPQGIYRFVGGTIDPAIVFNQRIQVLNGASSATSPAIQIDNQNSGFYRVNQGTIGIGISGVATGRWSSAGLNIFGVAGTAAAPAFVMNNDIDTGLYATAANQVGITCAGAQVGNWTSSGLSLIGSGVISNILGTVSLPSYTFNGDTNTGIYSSTADTIDFACGGVNRLSITSALADFAGTVQILTIRGKGGSSNIVTVAPITNDAVGTSILRITPNTGGWSATGTATLQFGDLNHTISVVNGTAMTLDVPTEIRTSVSGTQRLKVSSTGINTTGIAQTSIPMATMMTKSTAQSTATGSAVSVVSYNVSSNPSSYFTLNTTNGTIAFTVSDAPCMIFVSGQIQFPSGTTGVREIWIEDGSGSRWVDFNRNATSDAGDTSKSAIAGMRMITSNATYTLIMKIYQNTGGTINSGGIDANVLTTFCCARIN